MLKEFKEFIDRGGVLEAAVGLILALAFTPVIDRVVDSILMPIIAAIFGQPNFDTLAIDIGDAQILYGRVITAIVSFVLIALVLFVIVKAYNQATGKQDEDAGPSEIDLLTEIRDNLRK